MSLVRKYVCSALAIGALAMVASCGGGSGSAGGGGGGSSSSSSGGDPSGNITSRITIDGNRAGQTISGWEVTARFWEFDKVNDRYDASWLTSRDGIVQKLVDDAGINRVRVEVRSGVENPVDYWSQFVAGQISYNTGRNHYYEKINDNSDPAVANAAGFQWSSFDYYIQNFVLPMKAKLAASNKTLVVNLCFVDFSSTALQGTLSHSGSPNEYAELITLAAMRLRDRFGLTPDYLEVILEPDNGPGWTAAAVGRAIVAAKARLAAAGLNPKIIAPSTSAAGSTAGYLDGIATISGANSAINTVSYHRYDGAAADQALATIRQRASALGADTAMLEFDQASIQNFFKDMAFGGASAWQSYAAAEKADSQAGAANGAILWRNPSGALALTNQFSQIGLVQRNVLPGARAYAVTSQLGSDLSLVFRNPDGSETIAAFSPGGSTMEISGPAHTAYSATFAGPNGAAYTNSAVNTNATGKLVFTIPANTVVVLRSTN